MTEQKRQAVRKQMNDDNSKVARRAARNDHANHIAERDLAIRAAAREHMLVETLETRGNDGLDFYDCAVWGIKAALEAAYEAGRKSAQR